MYHIIQLQIKGMDPNGMNVRDQSLRNKTQFVHNIIQTAKNLTVVSQSTGTPSTLHGKNQLMSQQHHLHKRVDKDPNVLLSNINNNNTINGEYNNKKCNSYLKIKHEILSQTGSSLDNDNTNNMYKLRKLRFRNDLRELNLLTPTTL